MLSIKRSGGGLYWHVLYNGTVLDCCTTKREAMAHLETYKAYEGLVSYADDAARVVHTADADAYDAY